MDLPHNTPELIRFRCNLCGAENQLEASRFHRELAHCTQCGSIPRYRGIIHLLSRVVGQAGRDLVHWLENKSLRGLGMSDWTGYADLLQSRLDYVNTFYHVEPRLNILDPEARFLGAYDFVISSDVFEHIAPPLDQAFQNLLALLKPGGTLLFSVPYTRAAVTAEHFPGLAEFVITDFLGTQILINRDGHGRYQVYDQLVFHGGDGQTLEMRVFCEQDLLDRLSRAGFVQIVVHDQPILDIGYYWPELAPLNPADPPLHAYLISAKRP